MLSGMVPLAGVLTGACLSAASAGEVRMFPSIFSASTASCLWLVEQLGGTISILLAPLATALIGRSAPGASYPSVLGHRRYTVAQAVGFSQVALQKCQLDVTTAWSSPATAAQHAGMPTSRVGLLPWFVLPAWTSSVSDMHLWPILEIGPAARLSLA